MEYFEARRAGHKTFNTRRGVVSTFLKFALQRGWLTENPLVRVPQKRIRRRKGCAVTLSAAEAKKVMEFVETNHPTAVPFFALCLFAGIRPCLRTGEILRLLELTERVRGSAPDFNFSCADALGETLMELGKFSEATEVLRRTLDNRVKAMPAAWQTANTRSLLGAALMGLKRFDEAEPLLADGYRGVAKARAMIPPIEKAVLRDCGDRVVRFFSEQQMDEKANGWKRVVLEGGTEVGKN